MKTLEEATEFVLNECGYFERSKDILEEASTNPRILMFLLEVATHDGLQPTTRYIQALCFGLAVGREMEKQTL